MRPMLSRSLYAHMKQGKNHMTDWEQTKARLKQRISEIAETNLFAVEKQKDELLSKLEIRLGKTREVIVRMISEM